MYFSSGLGYKEGRGRGLLCFCFLKDEDSLMGEMVRWGGGEGHLFALEIVLLLWAFENIFE